VIGVTVGNGVSEGSGLAVFVGVAVAAGKIRVNPPQLRRDKAKIEMPIKAFLVTASSPHNKADKSWEIASSGSAPSSQ
jgi:hypothetical protein